MEADLGRSVERYRSNWQAEIDSAAQYRALAEIESDESVRALYQNLELAEERHARFWGDQLRRAGLEPPDAKASWRARILIWIARRFGSGAIIGTIAEQERVDRNHYVRQSETHGTGMVRDERWHARILRQLASASRPRASGVPGGTIGRLEGRHRAIGGNALRAAVLGANDGLCSNLSLVMGVAGASSNSHVLITTGLAGLLAGACSMAIGEWLSVTSSRELAQREIRIEADEVALDPESEAEELRLIFESKGLASQEAKEFAERLMEDPQRAVDALAREELGLDPDELTGSATEAAVFSFLLFALGAVVPLAPFFFLPAASATVVSAVLSAVALFGLGALITVFTGCSAWRSGFRQLALGLLAALITNSLGRWIGSTLT